VGIGFAIPIDMVKSVVSQLLEHGKVEHAYIGVEMATVTHELAANVRLPVDHGVLVERVRPGSPAAEAGIHGGDTQVVVDGESFLVGGDVITMADGRTIESAEQLRSVVTSKQPGDELSLEVHGPDGAKEVKVKLGRQPNTPVG
jgi:S1-C subfamily serine protease